MARHTAARERRLVLAAEEFHPSDVSEDEERWMWRDGDIDGMADDGDEWDMPRASLRDHAPAPIRTVLFHDTFWDEENTDDGDVEMDDV